MDPTGLIAKIEAAWNSGDPDAVAANFVEDGVLIRAGRVVASGPEIRGWAAAAIEARPSVRLEMRFRAYTDPYLCSEYVVRFTNDEGVASALAGAEVFLLENGLIKRQHIYPVEVGEDSPLL